MTVEEQLKIEGLAGQLYSDDTRYDNVAWWHVLHEDVKNKYREKAKAQIIAFHRYFDSLNVPTLSEAISANDMLFTGESHD